MLGSLERFGIRKWLEERGKEFTRGEKVVAHAVNDLDMMVS